MSQVTAIYNRKKPFDEAKVIAIFNKKGGSGKSMIAMQLGAALSLRGYRTLVIDLDIQGTLKMWSNQAEEDKSFPATVISLAGQGRDTIEKIRNFIELYDFILVDCPSILGDAATWFVLHSADIGIIPVAPLLDNLWASVDAKGKGLSAKKQNPDLQLFYLASNVRNAKLYEYGIDILRSDEDVVCFESIISMRSTFAESQYFGTSVHSLGNRAKSAIAEIEAVANELLSYALSGSNIRNLVSI